MNKLQKIINILALIMFILLLLANNKFHTKITEMFITQTEVSTKVIATIETQTEVSKQITKTLKEQAEINAIIIEINDNILKTLSNIIK